MLAAIVSPRHEGEVPEFRLQLMRENARHPHAEDPKQSRPVADADLSPTRISMALEYN
jgi:hypothetical protein